MLTISNEVFPSVFWWFAEARTVDKWLAAAEAAAAAYKFINVSTFPYYLVGQREWKFVQSFCKGAGVGDVGDLRGNKILKG